MPVVLRNIVADSSYEAQEIIPLSAHPKGTTNHKRNGRESRTKRSEVEKKGVALSLISLKKHMNPTYPFETKLP